MIIELTLNNFHETSLDDFILDQQVSACFRKTDGTYRLTPVYYTEDWDLNARRNEAGKIISALQAGGAAFAAVEGDSLIGFACVLPGRFGSRGQYVDLAALYVSKPFRRQGVGRALFERACRDAKDAGGEKIYVSAHSAEESIAAYIKYGCVFAEEPDPAHIENEPFNLQLEYDLSSLL